MPNKNHNFLFDFLIDPKFRVGRHMLLIIAFAFIVIGQILFAFKDYTPILDTKIYWIAAINILIVVAFAFLNLYLLAPRFLLKSKFMEFFGALIAEGMLYIIFKSVIEHNVLLNLGIERNFNGITLLDLLSNTVLFAVCMASSSVSVLIEQWVKDANQINALQNTQLKSNIDRIKNQIDPKSLSNVLDLVVNKTDDNPQVASEILFKLSDVLRYELYDCKREKVLLESDISFIDKYLSLEQLCSQNRFTYTIDIIGKANRFIIPFVFIRIIQQILEQLPAVIDIHFNIDDKAVKFGCVVSGVDLMLCDFSEEQQQLAFLYKKEIEIKKNKETLEMQVELC